MQMRKRQLVGVVLAILGASLVPAIVGGLTTPVTSSFDFGAAVGLVPVFYFFSLAAAVILGLPLFFLARHYRVVRWWSALLGGAIVGALMAFVTRAPSFVRLSKIFWMAVMGAASGLVFWAIWRSL